MNHDELKRLIRESYLFPIAHAHKKTLGVLDDNIEKLKCLLETAEVTMQFLALLTLAQLRQDIRNSESFSFNSNSPIDLKNPSFGKWYGLSRDILRQYREEQVRLLIPELFEFWFKDSSKAKSLLQAIHKEAVEPLLSLRRI